MIYLKFEKIISGLGNEQALPNTRGKIQQFEKSLSTRFIPPNDENMLSHFFWVIRRFLGKGQFLDSLCRVTESISNDFVAWLSFVQFMMSRDFCDVVKTSRDKDFQYSAFVFVNAKWDEVSKKRLKRNYVFHSCLLTRDFNETQFITNQSSFSQKMFKINRTLDFLSHCDFGNNWMKMAMMHFW